MARVAAGERAVKVKLVDAGLDAVGGELSTALMEVPGSNGRKRGQSGCALSTLPSASGPPTRPAYVTGQQPVPGGPLGSLD